MIGAFESIVGGWGLSQRERSTCIWKPNTYKAGFQKGYVKETEN